MEQVRLISATMSGTRGRVLSGCRTAAVFGQWSAEDAPGRRIRVHPTGWAEHPVYGALLTGRVVVELEAGGRVVLRGSGVARGGSQPQLVVEEW